MDKYEMIMGEKIFQDIDGKRYLFNVPLYIKVLNKEKCSSNEIVIKLETLMENSNEIKNVRTINRVREYAENYVNRSGKRPNISIDTIKQIGLALMGNEFGFLVEIKDIITKEDRNNSHYPFMAD